MTKTTQELRTGASGRAILAMATDAAVTSYITGLGFVATDSELAAIAGLTSAADRLPYFTGSGTAALATFTAAGRALVDDANAAAQRTTLGAAALTDATQNVTVNTVLMNNQGVGGTLTLSLVAGELYCDVLKLAYLQNVVETAGGTMAGALKHTEIPYAPTGTTESIVLNDGNHQTLSLVSATGTVTVTLDVPDSSASGTIIVKQHASAAKGITWTVSAGTIKWLGTQPTWSSDATSSFRIVDWRWDSLNSLMFLRASLSGT